MNFVQHLGYQQCNFSLRGIEQNFIRYNRYSDYFDNSKPKYKEIDFHISEQP